MKRFGLLILLLLAVCLAEAKHSEDLPPDPAAIIRLSCTAHDERRKVVTAGEEHLATWGEVRWLAEAEVTYSEGHEPPTWRKVIGMTTWEREAQQTPSQIGKMGRYCVEWAKDVGEEIQKKRKAAKSR